LRTVRQALADGRARVIRIAPAEEGSMRELDDVLEFGMACHSGGTLELFVDPMLPRARLVVVGDSPLAAALTGLAPRVGLPVTVVAHGADATRFPDAEQVLASDEPAAVSAGIAAGAFVVVATQGRRDVQGLRAALALQARAIFFVASARKAAVLKAALVEAGQDAAAVAAIVAPAGQALGAQTPEEIALSVLVAVVAARRGASPPVAPEEPVVADASVSSAPAVASALPEPVAAAAASCCGSAPAPVAVVPVADLPVAKASCCGG
jgi:xanthine dehydrogenase accessory factor